MQAVQCDAGARQCHVIGAAAKGAAAVGKAEGHSRKHGANVGECGKLLVIRWIGKILTRRKVAHDAA